MINTTIERHIDELFELEQQLCLLLEEQQYEEFQALQNTLSKKVKALLDSNSAETLNNAIDKLKRLEIKLATLTSQAESCFAELKEKSLQQRRNKNRIKAYKE